jgi:hypothetical protein
MKLNTIVVIFLSLFIFYVIFTNYSNVTLESFDIPATVVQDDHSKDTQYQYLAPLPLDNTWTQDTQNAFIKKYNEYKISTDPSAVPITSPTIDNVNFMTVASEEEVKSYIDNGIWPWDTYVTNRISYLEEMTPDAQKNFVIKIVELWKKMYPNRMIYQIVGSSTLPQSTVLNALNPAIGNGLVLPDKANQNLICKYAAKSTIKQPDGTNIVIPENGYYPYVTSAKNMGNINGSYTLDYSIFKSIPGLAFDDADCNICSTKDFNYLDSKNQCKFSLKTPEAYDVYTGLNVKSTPANIASA